MLREEIGVRLFLYLFGDCLQVLFCDFDQPVVKSLAVSVKHHVIAVAVQFLEAQTARVALVDLRDCIS